MAVGYRDTLGCTEAVISDNGGLKCFYRVANVLTENMKLKFIDKEDEMDSVNWWFKFKGYRLTLHYDIYNGISVFPKSMYQANARENNAVKELALQLGERLNMNVA